MSEHEKEIDRRKDRKRRKELRLAKRLETIRNMAVENGEPLDGDPFAIELRAKLQRFKDKDRWSKRSAITNDQRRRFRNGFKPPLSWKSEEQKGLSILEKALLFVSAFRARGLGFRQVQILIMVAGRDAISIQQTADLCGLTFQSTRHAIGEIEKEGYIEITKSPRIGRQPSLCIVNLTESGAAVMRALNRFDPDVIGDYDKAVALGIPHVHTDLRILQMKGLIDEANNIAEDL